MLLKCSHSIPNFTGEVPHNRLVSEPSRLTQLTGHQASKPPTSISILPPPELHPLRHHRTHTSEWYPSAQVTAQLSPMVQEAQPGPDKEPLRKRSPMYHVSASQMGYGSVRRNCKSIQWKPPSLKSLHCRMPRLCSGSRDSLWKEA